MEVTFEFSEKVLGIVLEEEVDSDKLKEIKELIGKRLTKNQEVNLYLEDRYNNGITLKAILKDLVYELTNYEPYVKIAVVTDKKSFRAVTEIKDVLLNIKVQSFELKDRVKAMNWVIE